MDGLYGLLLVRRNLLLRFELPRLESALLGLDPQKLLEESELYLFEMEQGGSAEVRFKE